AKNRERAAVNDVDPTVTSWWAGDGFGDSRTARRELEGVLPGIAEHFAIPKPIGLIRHILKLVTTPSNGDVVLDCFAGSGTTAHAVLEQNVADGGDRRFVLVELEDYADTLTAERVRRVLKGSGGQPHVATGFDYYELDGPFP
ncbi:MAG: site-specific DNA-methyltransferase, partial [Actinomycetota bacterium]|nr:site-specific DNA-methyltransferase [Actinomycetota bacterium]